MPQLCPPDDGRGNVSACTGMFSWNNLTHLFLTLFDYLCVAMKKAMVGEAGLEPAKAKPADLQSAPFAARDIPPSHSRITGTGRMAKPEQPEQGWAGHDG
jgi:hypothetical protein